VPARISFGEHVPASTTPRATLITAAASVPTTFAAVMLVAALAGTIATLAARRGLAVPVVVIELLFGVLIGPQLLGLPVDELLRYMSYLGLGLLFFLAGYEIDPKVIAGRPLRLAGFGWAISLAIAYSAAAILQSGGVVLSLLYTGSALATTSMGMLIPVLADGGDLRSRYGINVMACGAVGEFGPIMLMTLFLSAQSTLHEAGLLVAFTVAAGIAGAAIGIFARRSREVLESTMEQSSQLAIRWILFFALALAVLAHELGLDLVLGGFVAGLLTRRAAGGELPQVLHSKLNAIAYGVFIPFFFVESGMSLDVSALFGSVADVTRLLAFFVLMFVARGVPALLLYREELGPVDRRALALMSSTQLTLVIAITSLATQTGHMRAGTQAALIGASAMTTVLFPTLAARLRQAVPSGAPEAA